MREVSGPLCVMSTARSLLLLGEGNMKGPHALFGSGELPRPAGGIPHPAAVRKHQVAVCIAAACLLAASGAFARGAAVRSAGRAHFDLGRAHYKAGEYQAAISDFERGYALEPMPLFLYNIAQAARHAG